VSQLPAQQATSTATLQVAFSSFGIGSLTRMLHNR